jgi:hypothetical protein
MGNFLILEHVLQNMQVAIQECATTGTIDLQEYLPAELVQSDIVQKLLNRVGFSADHGVAVLVDDKALIISRDLVKEIHQNVLPPLIQSFAKTRSEEMFRATPSLEQEEETPSTNTTRKKGKSRSRKAKNTLPDKSSDDKVPARFVPLLQVAGAVLKEYPSFMNETVEEDLLNQADTIAWDDEEDSGIILVEFCKVALYTEDFRSKCDKAVRAELDCLQSAKQSKATLSRKDAASKVRSAEAAFEDAFVTVCYLIQSFAKFIALASSSKHFDEASLEVLRCEFLQGCCADLTSRLTQYCMFQNEEDVIFTFQHSDDECEKEGAEQSTNLPACCAAVDPAIRQYHRSYLSCPPPRDPLPVLRESLPGNMGVTLARQWVLCGGECYQGGVRKSEEDDTVYTRPGNMDDFVSHVEDNCL